MNYQQWIEDFLTDGDTGVGFIILLVLFISLVIIGTGFEGEVK